MRYSGLNEQLFASVPVVPELWPEEAGILRRSIAMLPPEAPSGLSRERALATLGQLVRALRELRRWRRYVDRYPGAPTCRPA